MRFTVLALDYDGTIARDGVLEPDGRRAIEEVRKPIAQPTLDDVDDALSTTSRVEVVAHYASGVREVVINEMQKFGDCFNGSGKFLFVSHGKRFGFKETQDAG